MVFLKCKAIDIDLKSSTALDLWTLNTQTQVFALFRSDVLMASLFMASQTFVYVCFWLFQWEIYFSLEVVKCFGLISLYFSEVINDNWTEIEGWLVLGLELEINGLGLATYGLGLDDFKSVNFWTWTQTWRKKTWSCNYGTWLRLCL